MIHNGQSATTVPVPSLCVTAAAIAMMAGACRAQERIDWVGYQYTCSSPLNFPDTASFFDPQNWLGYVVPSGTPGTDPNDGTTAWFGRMGNPVGGEVPTTVFFGDFCYNPGVGCPGDQFVPTQADWYVDQIELETGSSFTFNGNAKSVGNATCPGFGGQPGGVSTGFMYLGSSAELSLVDIEIASRGIFGLHGSRVKVTGSSSLVVVNGVYMLGSSTSPGVLTVTGPATRLTAGPLSMPTGNVSDPARPEFAEVYIEEGGLVEVEDLSIGTFLGGVGRILVDGMGNGRRSTLRCTGPTSGHSIGNNGHGTLVVQDGGLVSLEAITRIANGSTSTGSIVVTGVGSELSTSAELVVGSEGDGTLRVESGGSVSLNSLTYIGALPGSSGRVVVAGAGSEILSSRRLIVGSAGAGTLEVTDDGVFQSTGTLLVGASVGSSGEVIVAGAGSRVGASAIDLGNSWTGAPGNLTIRDGGVFESADTFDITPSGLLRGTGTLRVQSPTGLVNEGTISPGEGHGDIGVITVDGDVTLGNWNHGGVYQVDVIAGSDFQGADRMVSSGDVVVGGEIVVVAHGDAFAAGQRFDILAAASISGGFSSVTLPPIAEGLYFELVMADTDASGSADTVRLQVVSDCPSDLTSDGSLDFFDFFAYLALYNAGDPAADLADPAGVFNFADVTAYIDAYNAGCP